MAEENTSPKKTYSLKPIIILTVAAILIAKAQRAAAEDSIIITTTEDSGTDTDTAVCPEYCNLPPDRATKGKAPFRMWYYDSSEGSCRRFKFGGRGGNKNRFYKRAECEETCSKCTINDIEDDDATRENRKSNLTKDDACFLPLDEGQCDHDSADLSPKIPQLMWHYAKENAKCSPFIFYGCGGNNNRFSSQKECEESCH